MLYASYAPLHKSRKKVEILRFGPFYPPFLEMICNLPAKTIIKVKLF
jgi:hypothetical protein